MTGMVREGEIRRGEQAVQGPEAGGAGLVFIGRIRTPWTSRLETPRQGRLDGPVVEAPGRIREEAFACRLGRHQCVGDTWPGCYDQNSSTAYRSV